MWELNLKPQHEYLIRKVCKIQKNVLEELIHRDHLEVAIHSSNEDVDHSEMVEEMKSSHREFSRVIVTPNHLANLRNHNLYVFKHILASNHKKYKSRMPETVRQIWKFINNLERFNLWEQNLN